LMLSKNLGSYMGTSDSTREKVTIFKISNKNRKKLPTN
jgi:hypothetical protein